MLYLLFIPVGEEKVCAVNINAIEMSPIVLKYNFSACPVCMHGFYFVGSSITEIKKACWIEKKYNFC